MALPVSQFLLESLNRIRAVLMVTCCLLIVSCSGSESPPLRMGCTQWPGFETFFVAREQRFWHDNQIRLLEYTSTAELSRAFRNGTVDAGLFSLDEVLRLAEDVPDIDIILVTDISNGADVILAKPEMRSMKDLKGRRIGAETTGLGAYVLYRALQLSSLSREDVEIVPLDFSEQGEAFKQGLVDAVVTYEPLSTKLKKAGARQLFDSTRIPGEIVDVMVIRKSYLKASPENALLLFQAFYRAQSYAKEHPGDFLRIASTRENATPQEFRQSITLIKVPDATEGSAMFAGRPSALQKQAQALVEVMTNQKLLRRPVDVDSLFDSDLSRHAPR